MTAPPVGARVRCRYSGGWTPPVRVVQVWPKVGGGWWLALDPAPWGVWRWSAALVQVVGQEGAV